MKAILIVAIAAAMPSAASAVTVSFGGVFGADAPITAFSRPGDRFRVQFNSPRQFINGGNQVFASYTTRGITQQRNAFFNLGTPGLLPQGFTFAPGELFSFSGFNLSFLARRPFYEVIQGNVVRLTQTAQLFGGTVRSFQVSGVTTGSIVSPSAIRIVDGPEPCPILNFSGTPCVSSVSLASLNAADSEFSFADREAFQSSVPEPGTWALLITGFGAVGATLRRRRQAPLAA